MALYLSFLPQSCSLKGLPLRSAVMRASGDAIASIFHVKCLASSQTSKPMVDGRRSTSYQPNVWNYDFVESLKSDYTVEKCETWANKLKDEIRRMLDVDDDDDDAAKPLELLELIDDIQRLGLGYHFEDEINIALNSILSLEQKQLIMEKSLHATALRFRLLRQHGYMVSQDVFERFKDQMGNFNAWHLNDVKGMLSLYEASHLAFEGEDLLDKAKTFTSRHLQGLMGNIDTDLAKEVSHALELPLHRRMLRLEARWYIEAYASRKDNTNHLLLELAKLDFNMVQSTHQSELIEMLSWWRGMGLGNQLNFARDRLIECFFWAVGMIFEPKFSRCRKALTKIAILVTIIDDVYDIYGSLDELELFTDAVERWDMSSMEELPDDMKLCFLALYTTVDQMAYDTIKEHGCNSLSYLKQAWADLCKAFLQEAKWYYNREIPVLKDYLDNAWVSVSGIVFLVHAYFLVTENITNEELECLESYPNIIRQSSMVFRLCNDSVELEETTNSISCYMHETGLSEELARDHIKNLINEMWKKMNKDGVTNSPFPNSFLGIATNLARISHCTYQYGDGHSAPDCKAKERILSLLVDPVHL